MSSSRSLLVADHLRLARAVPHHRGIVAKEVIGQPSWPVEFRGQDSSGWRAGST
jgi:hypothetical protein